jgi:ferredoxin-nitrate reductase
VRESLKKARLNLDLSETCSLLFIQRIIAMGTRNSIIDVWGDRQPYVGVNQWPARVDEHLIEEPDHWIQSCCVLCTNGCGLDIGVKDGRIVGVRGRADDIISRGRLGPKGLHAWQANESPDRLTRPLIRNGAKGRGEYREATWPEAMDFIVSRCSEIRDEFTSGAIGFYNSGQLFLEDYYTLSVIAHAGLGTNHIDGNTRLCTATASMSLRETFGSDGQPATIRDYDTADCIVHFGHNIADTQTVSWMRILDRRRGANPPKLIVVDPRITHTAQEADLHLRPELGTNVALLNGLLHLVIQNGHIDREFIENHTVGFERLQDRVLGYSPDYVEHITGVPAAQLKQAAEWIGRARQLVCTVLQGVYQSNQATAAACQVNNLVLIRGMIGRSGCGVIQSNGQPTAQNARETGCNGEWPGFRNWQNERHMADLAKIWNVDELTIPHWAPKTHAMKLFHLAELGVIKFLWIIGTNPAVSLPELHKVRRTLQQHRLFTIVQDAFMTETALMADVVLPAALWGEKTGTFTNFDRTVHISHKAVEPPGEARTDMDILLDFARRMNFRDKDGHPLVKWATPEECYEAWKICSKGTPCDYSGLSYAMLSKRSGIRWPCNEEYPDGKDQLYAELKFPTGFEDCGDFGHDLETGGHTLPEKYKANDPQGKAWLKAADFLPPAEQTDDDYPFWLSTGRLVHHFHTRTKTGRSPQLNAAAPDAYIEVNADDAKQLGVIDGDMLEVSSRRGSVQVAVKIGGVLPNHLFMPFHYGYWDEPGSNGWQPNGRPRAANELTITAWDAVSKQPQFKFAAVRAAKVGAASSVQRVTDIARHAVDKTQELATAALASMHSERSRVSDYLSLLKESNLVFRDAARQVAMDHSENAEVARGSEFMRRLADEAIGRLQPFLQRYGTVKNREPRKLHHALFSKRRFGDFGLLRELHDLFLLASEVYVVNSAVLDAAKELRDCDLVGFCLWMEEQCDRQKIWCMTQVKENAAQALVVPQ